MRKNRKKIILFPFLPIFYDIINRCEKKQHPKEENTVLLQKLLEGIPYKMLQGTNEVEIKMPVYDSRKVQPGDLFVCITGFQTDGHRYIPMALEKGAAALLVEHAVEDVPENIMVIQTENNRQALAALSANFYDHPTQKMRVTGVTGTNGKTTITYLVRSVLERVGRKTGVIGTIENRIGDKVIPTERTTPESLELQALMEQMRQEDVTDVMMEVSSHSLDLHRVDGIAYEVAVFTNLTQDHLDYHKTFKAYIEAKKAFFDRLPAHAFALTNADDKNGLVMLQNTRAHRYTYSCRTMADFTAKVLEKHLDGTLLRLDGEEVWTKFTGDFNAYNLLAVYAAARLLGFPKENVLEYVSLLVPVSGRFETLISTEGVMAVVDYAHTPDAVENVLSTICGLKGRDNQVITVVGAGGDRDKTKRPEMADAACRYSDHVILTSDNPRSEDPEQIIRDMLTGVKEGFQYRVEAITDRKEAIRKAIGMASKGDIILVAGKGHENYQEVKGVKHHFDDKEVIREIFDLSNR